MTRSAVDHSTGGAIIGGTLRRDGYQGAVRYAAQGRGNVNINASEYRDLVNNGIPVGIVVEHEATWLLRGFEAVAALTHGARNVWRAAGVPDGVTYFAADFDATEGGPTSPGSRGDQNMHQIASSLHGAASVIGAENVGFYGSPFAIDWLRQHEPWVKWFWDTEAWGMGRKPHPDAHLYQFARSANVAGVSCDVDEILKADWGAREVIRPIPHPAPKPKRRPIHKPIVKPHPKVTVGAATAALTTAIEATLHAVFGLKITPAEATAVTGVASFLASYFAPVGTPR